MRRILLTDIDETVLTFSRGFENWMAVQGLPVSGALRDQYSIARAFDITEEQAQDALNAFCHSDGYMSLEPEPCALTVLPKLYEAGWRFVAITAVTSDLRTARLRRKNLEDVFGFPWDAVHCIGLHGDKRPALSAYEPGVWVEDHWYNAVAGAGCGHRTFLLDRPYNRERTHPEVTRCTDWHEIETALRSE